MPALHRDQVETSSCLLLFCAAPATPSTPAYEKKDIPGKGIGLVATRHLKAGDLVLKDRPLVILENNGNHLATPAELEFAYRKLSEADRQLYDSLSVSEANKDLSGSLAISKTNAIQLGVGSKMGGVFAEGSRFNHSCSPNCHGG